MQESWPSRVSADAPLEDEEDDEDDADEEGVARPSPRATPPPSLQMFGTH
jgi:hypothetical protein